MVGTQDTPGALPQHGEDDTVDRPGSLSVGLGLASFLFSWSLPVVMGYLNVKVNLKTAPIMISPMSDMMDNHVLHYSIFLNISGTVGGAVGLVLAVAGLRRSRRAKSDLRRTRIAALLCILALAAQGFLILVWGGHFLTDFDIWEHAYYRRG